MCIGQFISCRSPGEVRVLAWASRAGIISALIHGVSRFAVRIDCFAAVPCF